MDRGVGDGEFFYFLFIISQNYHKTTKIISKVGVADFTCRVEEGRESFKIKIIVKKKEKKWVWPTGPVNNKMHASASAARGKVWGKLVLQKDLNGKADYIPSFSIF